MLRQILAIVIFAVLVAPACTLVHELGHAIVPILKSEKVQIRVGVKPVLSYSIKNVSMDIGFRNPWVGSTQWSSEERSLIRLAAGPLASLLVGITLLRIRRRTTSRAGRSLLVTAAYWCLLQFMFTVIPISYPSWMAGRIQESDGKQILQILREN